MRFLGFCVESREFYHSVLKESNRERFFVLVIFVRLCRYYLREKSVLNKNIIFIYDMMNMM